MRTFDFKLISKDTLSQAYTSSILHRHGENLGRYTDTFTHKEWVSKISTLDSEFIRYIPRFDLSVFKFNVGPGWQRVLNVTKLQELIERKVIDGDQCALFVYRYGNIFCYVDTQTTGIDFLKTEDTCVVVQNSTTELWWVNLGDWVYPNRMYYREDLHEFRVRLKLLHRIEGINNVIFTERITDQ